MTLSASPVDTNRSMFCRMALRYLLITILCAIIGMVYELFSHGVYAYSMLYAFAFPLLGGVLPFLLLAKYGKQYPSEASLMLWHFGISALTIGSFFSGALSIYGTTSRLTVVYWLVGGVCMLLSLLTLLFVPNKKVERTAISCDSK